jgi:hypothetical protein
MEDITDDLSEDEMKELLKNLSYGSPQPDEKMNVHTFLSHVLKTKDTTRVGFLTEEELGGTKYPLRTYKVASNFAEKIMGNSELGKYFIAKGEVITATSLSKNAKLIELAVVQRRELADVTKHRKLNKGWFKKKDENTME